MTEEPHIAAKRILNSAADLIERGWSQFAMARDPDGNRVSIYSKKAANFCSLGAITKAASRVISSIPSDGEWLAISSLTNDLWKNSHIGISAWNDSHGQTKENVVATLQRVAEEIADVSLEGEPK